MKQMTESQKRQCNRIIHVWSAAAGAGNLSPLPGTGFAADTAALTMMAVELSQVFGQDMAKAAARGVALSAIKRQLLKRPLKTLGKELAKLVPFGGQALSCGVSVAIAEAAGWSMADDFSRNCA